MKLYYSVAAERLEISFPDLVQIRITTVNPSHTPPKISTKSVKNLHVIMRHRYHHHQNHHVLICVPIYRKKQAITQHKSQKSQIR